MTRVLALILLATGTPEVHAQRRPAAPARAPQLSPLEQRIRSVETGLLPPIRIRGRSLANMTIAARMKKHAVTGVSIAVINDFGIEWARGYGTASAGAAVDTTLRFPAGAAGQPLAAAVAMILVQNKKLDLNRDVNRTLKTWKVPKSDFTRSQPVTLRTLLSRTSGLSPVNFTELADDSGRPLDRLKLVTIDQIPTLEYRENGADYLVLEQLLVDHARKPFGELAGELLFDPLGMKRSEFKSAAAGLWTTPSDLARFLVELESAASGRGGRILKQETATQMLTSERYGPAGLGLMPVGSDSTLRVIQRGASGGAQTEMIGFIRRGQGAVVMTAGAGGAALAGEILNAIATVYQWPGYVPPPKVVARVDPRVYPRYAGQYRLDGRSISVAIRSNRLYLGAAGRENVELLPESVSEFFTGEGDAIYSFVFDENGKVNSLTVKRRSGDERWSRSD